jgi:hypothetical protein
MRLTAIYASAMLALSPTADEPTILAAAGFALEVAACSVAAAVGAAQ